MMEVDHIELLLIEDSPLDAELARRSLRESKLVNKIVWISDGAQALDYLLRRGEYAKQAPRANPSLILLDLKMPRVDGIEVLKVIKRNATTKRIPVIVMTSSREEADIAKSYDLGANSYIVKPIQFEELAAVARNAGFYWMAVNRSPGAG